MRDGEAWGAAVHGVTELDMTVTEQQIKDKSKKKKKKRIKAGRQESSAPRTKWATFLLSKEKYEGEKTNFFPSFVNMFRKMGCERLVMS